MTGLLLKEFLYLRQHGKLFLLVIAFYAVFFSLFPGEGLASCLTALVVVMAVMFVINSFAYDELAKWDRFAFSLPVTRKQAVLSKYLFALILAAAVSALALLATAAAGKGSAGGEDRTAVYASFGASIAFCSILIPLIYKFGLQKARVTLLILFLAPTLIILLLQKARLSLFAGGAPGEAQIVFWLKLSPLLLPALFVGSYLISCGIMEKKEV